MYNGYTVKIGSTIINPDIMVIGSYQCKNERAVISSWRDANGRMHYHFYPEAKTNISFSIRPRTVDQQRSIQHLFNTLDNLTVEYYNDVTEQYETGVFKMDDVVFKHQYDTQDVMFFAETQIVLREY